MKAYRQDLRLQLLILYSLFVVSVFVLALMFYAREAQRLQHNVTEADLSLARAIALETDDLLLKAKHAAISFSQMEAVIQADPNEMEAVFTAGSSARQDVSRIARLSANGVMRYHYPLNLSSIIGQDFSFTDYFQEAQTTKDHVFSKPHISPSTDGPVITSAHPVFEDGRFDGVVALNLELTGLVKTLEQINLQRAQSDKVNIIVVDNNRRITAHSRPENLLDDISDDLPFLEAALAGEEGDFIATDAVGTEWLYNYTPISSAGWTVIVQHRTDLAYASLYNFQRGLFIALVIFGGGALLFWTFLSYRVIGPLQRLTRYGERVGEQLIDSTPQGQRIYPLAQREDQVGRLALTLLEAEQSVRRRLTELTTLNKTSLAVLSTLDTEQVIDTILNEIQRLLQVEQCAVQVVNEVTNRLEIQASRGLPESYALHLNEAIDFEELPAFWTITTKKPVQIPDIDAETFSSILPLAEIGKYRALLAIPLITLHGPPAALVIYRPDVHQFSLQEVDLAANFANQAATALEHALLFRLTDTELQKQVRFLSALHQVGHTVSQSLVMDEILNNAIDTVFEITPSDACWIFLRREMEEFLRLRAQRGLAPALLEQIQAHSPNMHHSVPGYIVASDQPLLLNPEKLPMGRWTVDPLVSEGDWRWLAAVPLRAKDTPIGVLGMTTRGDRTYTENEVELLQAIGDQIAIAVVNARLYRQSRELATLEERNRVAREIHDTLIQGLTGILVHLQGAKRLNEKKPEQATQRLDDALELSQESLREARRSVLNLRPIELEALPLHQAIAQQVKRIAKADNLQSQFEVEGYPSPLKSDVEQHLYRITQEALTNIKRHAQATKVGVKLTFEPQSVTLAITDNGVGLNGTDSASRDQDKLEGGFGLVGIQERVRLIGGQVTIDSSAVAGTEIKVVIPK